MSFDASSGLPVERSAKRVMLHLMFLAMTRITYSVSLTISKQNHLKQLIYNCQLPVTIYLSTVVARKTYIMDQVIPCTQGPERILRHHRKKKRAENDLIDGNDDH